jgi:protein TonB
VVFDPVDLPTVAVKALPAPSGGPRPEGVKVVRPPADANTFPSETPRALPTADHGGEVAGDPDAPVGPAVTGLPPGPAPVAPQVHAAQIVELDAQAVRVLHQVPPVYPALARLLRAQGPVELRMTIDAAGVPMEIQVVSGPHPLLVNEALRVARLWRFQPATLNGAAVAATFRLTVAFRLER